MDFEFGVVEAIETVPEPFRALYAKAEEGDNAGKYMVRDDVRPVADAILGLNKANKAIRAEMKSKTGVDLTPLREYGNTVEEIQANVKQKLDELEAQAAGSKEAKLNLDKVRNDLAKAHAIEIQSHEQRNKALQSQLYSILVENKATAAIAEAKGDPDLLMPFITPQVKVVEEDGKITTYVIDSQGDRRYSGVTGQPMTVKELVVEMKGNAKYARLFDSDQKGGGGTPPGAMHRKSSVEGEKRSSVQKISAGLSQLMPGK